VTEDDNATEKTTPKEKPSRVNTRPALPKDKFGKTILPYKMSNSVILALGDIVYDRPKYHTERHIFPVGFVSTRESFSVKHPGQKTRYTNKILDGGVAPLFEVYAADDPDKVYSANTSSGVW
jgi:hypothetical protein